MSEGPCRPCSTRRVGSSRRPSSPPRPTPGPGSTRRRRPIPWPGGPHQAERLTWDRHWDQVLDWELPFAKWFVGGPAQRRLQLRRPPRRGRQRGDRVAYHWVGEPEGETRTITYADLQAMVCQAANALTELGVVAGDRVAIYMPMIPEAVVAMLACARLGAPHSVVFGGFSRRGPGRPDPRRRRPAGHHRRRRLPAGRGLRPQAPGRRGAPASAPRCARCWWCAAPARTSTGCDGRDVWWHDVVDRQTEHPRGRGLRRRAPALHHVHQRAPRPSPRASSTRPAATWCTPRPPTGWSSTSSPSSDVFWTAADIGWVTGHSYIVYGPLANGTTSVMYEGTPDAGGRDRWWRIVEELQGLDPLHRPDHHPHPHEVGRGAPGGPRPLEPAPARARWASPSTPRPGCGTATTSAGTAARSSTPGGRPRPAGIMIAPLPGITATKPGAAMRRPPGHRRRRGRQRRRRRSATARAATWCSTGRGPGCCGASGATPSATRRPTGRGFAGRYFAGDGAKKDEDGDLWLLGRVDDVMNISGHRISTTEIEHALVGHPPGGRGGGGRGHRPDHRPGHRGLRHRQGRRAPDDGGGRRGAGRRAARDRRGHDRAHRQAPADPAHPRAARRPAAARSCGGCSATWPSTATWATSPP